MKSFRLGRWASQLTPPGTRQRCPYFCRTVIYSIRLISTTTPAVEEEQTNGIIKKKRGRPRKNPLPLPPVSVTTTIEPILEPSSTQTKTLPAVEPTPAHTPPARPRHPFSLPLERLPSPPITSYTTSAKLSALYARLALPSRLPIQTFARTLIDKTADPDNRFNNTSLGSLGNDLLGYYMGEHLLCHYPRIPIAVLFAALASYIAPKSLGVIAEEWGVEVAAEPGGEVDPGLLQFRRTKPGTILEEVELNTSTRPDKYSKWRRGLSSRIVYDDEFGNLKAAPSSPLDGEGDGESTGAPHTTIWEASATFVRAVFAAIYLHAGAQPTYNFFKAHILSRHLNLSALFTFTQPTRDLSRLCAREGFESPVARVISETGRLSRHPVFVVGVFSGRDKLGESAGASLDEARFKASVAALKGWYLYSPAGEIMVPSQAEAEKARGKEFKPAVIDDGEIIV